MLDIASRFFSRGSFNLRDEGFKGKMIEISSETFKKGYRHLKLKQAFLFNTKFLADYDTVIFSGDCISAVKNARVDAKKIYYCHTPPRYLYDLREEYLTKLKPYLKPIFNLISWVFRKMYESDVKKFDLILTNSKNTQSRLEHFIGKKSEVLYPPVKLDEFKWIEQGDYYISVSRLSSAKRIDNIVKAFSQMSDKKLIVIYGVNDPQKDEIFELGKDSENIEFVTCPGNEGFTDYIGKSIAGICIPINEDFGMVPVESMAAGKPVIGVDEGGIKESVINGETGVLIPEGGAIEDIIEATKYLTPEVALSMKEKSEERAKYFSYKEFEEK
ncbi:MAG: glycosyltransferase [Candidatus Gracilibacteria bacterium]|nr:glycosyltransferase [Candidatus Gracilibacteria bacterium]